MGSFTDVGENYVLDHILGTTSFSPTTPMKLALETIIGSDSAAGTEATGGSYARQTVAFDAAASGATQNTSDVVFLSMPACTVVGVAVYDSNGSPKRIFWGPLGANKTCAAGDTFTISAGDLDISLD